MDKKLTKLWDAIADENIIACHHTNRSAGIGAYSVSGQNAMYRDRRENPEGKYAKQLAWFQENRHTCDGVRLHSQLISIYKFKHLAVNEKCSRCVKRFADGKMGSSKSLNNQPSALADGGVGNNPQNCEVARHNAVILEPM